MPTQFREQPGSLEVLLSMLGHAPAQPPVQGMYSPEDLYQMRLEASQGRDMGRVRRIEEVQKLRQKYGMPDAMLRSLPPDVESKLLGNGETGGLMEPVHRAMDAREQLLRALQTRPAPR